MSCNLALVRNRVARLALFVFGVLFIVIGIIGAFVPILPTTPFILLAAWCFLKSSEKAHRWIYSHSVFGEPLKNWKENRAISRSSKLISITMIFISSAHIYMTISNFWIRYILLAVLVGVSIFIGTTRDR